MSYGFLKKEQRQYDAHSGIDVGTGLDLAHAVEDDATCKRRTHPKGEPAVDDPEIGVSLGERRAGAFADARIQAPKITKTKKLTAE